MLHSLVSTITTAHWKCIRESSMNQYCRPKWVEEKEVSSPGLKVQVTLVTGTKGPLHFYVFNCGSKRTSNDTQT